MTKCGKSTTGRVILRLLEPTSGEIIFEGKDVSKLSKNQVRHKIQVYILILLYMYSFFHPLITIIAVIVYFVNFILKVYLNRQPEHFINFFNCILSSLNS